MRHLRWSQEKRMNLGDALGRPPELRPIGEYERPVVMGEDQTNPKDLIGIKKPRLYLVPPSSIIYQALAMQDGAAKYGPYNWREKKVIASIYLDAAKRHIDAWLDGEENAEDSGYPHLGHAIACLGIIVDALETGNLVDDRPEPGAAAAVLKRFSKEG